MPKHFSLKRSAPTLRFWIAIAFLGLCCLTGGSSFDSMPGLLILQPTAVIAAALVLLLPGTLEWRTVAVPAVLLAGLAGLMLIQLLPLPPGLWLSMPGHAQFAPILSFDGLAQAWRPTSLTPDLTLESLAGLVTPAAVLIMMAALTKEQSARLLPALLIAIGLSALLGVAQIATGMQSALYFYSISNFDSPVGFLANRNHQAALLVTVYPALAVWVFGPVNDRKQRNGRLIIGGAFALFVLPLLLVTGSRAGLILAVIGLALGAWITQLRPQGGARSARLSRQLRLALIAAGLAMIAATYLVSRAEAFRRLFGVDVMADKRAQAFPTIARITTDFFPFGTGFGSFDRVFRFYEPFDQLNRQYLNHAHNDLLEWVMTGGIGAVVLLIAFLCWVAMAGWRAARSERWSASAFGRLAVSSIAILCLASLVDYPLRTPLMSAYLALLCGWLGRASRAAEPLPAKEPEKPLPASA